LGGVQEIALLVNYSVVAHDGFMRLIYFFVIVSFLTVLKRSLR